MKCGNIPESMKIAAWEIIEMGLLATRYVILFADSMSLASFYTTGSIVDPSKAINVEDLRQEFLISYKEGDITLATHPILRRYGDPECDEDPNVEMAKVAAVSCMHHCLPNYCGGAKKHSAGQSSSCRFDFPKKNLNYTVPAIMEINSEQMECRMLLRRTCNRVPNLNRYMLRYWRANHDVTVLVDAAHKMRYATKYAAKSGKYNELMDEILNFLTRRSIDVLPPNTKQV